MATNNIKFDIATGRRYGYQPMPGRETQFADAARQLDSAIHSTHGDAFRYGPDEYQRRRQQALKELALAIEAIERVSAVTPEHKPTLA